MNRLPELLEQFRYCRLTVTLQLQASGKLPAYKGSMLHGWFGQALRRYDEEAYKILFGIYHNQQPKPYVVVTPPDYRTQYAASEIFNFSFVVLGQACKLLPRIVAALEQGSNLGFGPNRITAKVLSVSSELPGGSVLGISEATLSDYVGQRLASVAQATLNVDEQQLAIQLITPMRIKHKNQQLNDSLRSVGFIGIQVARRLTQLARFWVNDNEELLTAIMANQPYYKELEFIEHLYVEKWDRFSLKQQQAIPFSGLKGQVSAFGNLTALLPLLYVGECIHVGGKTTFGMGEIKIAALV